MRKIFRIISISILAIIMMTGCNRNLNEEASKIDDNKDSQEIIKVMESVYVDYVNDIHLDSDKYIGKTIEIEGIFTEEKDDDNKNHLYVYRLTDTTQYSHDDESHDHNHEEEEEIYEVETKCGLEFEYSGDYPKENDWIKVIGKLELRDENIIINADSVEVMEERGLEKVKQFY